MRGSSTNATPAGMSSPIDPFLDKYAKLVDLVDLVLNGLSFQSNIP